MIQNNNLFISILNVADEKDQREGTTSPDLFSTPPEDQEHLSDNKVSILNFILFYLTILFDMAF